MCRAARVGCEGRASLGLSPAIRTAQAEIDTPPSLARPASPARWDVTAAQSALVVGDEAAVTRPRTLTAGGGTAVWATAAAVPRIVPETDRTTAIIEASTRRRCVVSLLLDGPHRAAGVSEHRQRFLHGRSTRAGLDRGRAGGDGGPPPVTDGQVLPPRVLGGRCFGLTAGARGACAVGCPSSDRRLRAKLSRTGRVLTPHAAASSAAVLGAFVSSP